MVVCIFNAETDCLPLITQESNVTRYSIGTVANVTCSSDMTFNTSSLKMTSVVSTCNTFGNWVPPVPECISKFIYTIVLLGIYVFNGQFNLSCTSQY